MSIQSILDHKGDAVVSIHPAASVKQAVDQMRRLGVAALVVKSSEAEPGIITERDIVVALSQVGPYALDLPIASIAGRPVTVSPRDSVKRAMTLMTQHRVRHLLVIEGGRDAGIVSIGDVIKHRLEDLELEANVLRDNFLAAHAGVIH